MTTQNSSAFSQKTLIGKKKGKQGFLMTKIKPNYLQDKPQQELSPKSYSQPQPHLKLEFKEDKMDELNEGIDEKGEMSLSNNGKKYRQTRLSDYSKKILKTKVVEKNSPKKVGRKEKNFHSFKVLKKVPGKQWKNEPKKTKNYARLKYLNERKNQIETFYCFHEQDMGIDQKFSFGLKEQACDNDCSTDDEQIKGGMKSLFRPLKRYLEREKAGLEPETEPEKPVKDEEQDLSSGTEAWMLEKIAEEEEESFEI